MDKLFNNIDIDKLNEMDIINKLIEINYIITKNNIETIPILGRSRTLVSRAIKKDPAFLLCLDDDDIENYMIEAAIDNGLVVTPEEMIKKPALFNSESLIVSCIEQDPNLIVIMPAEKLNDSIISAAFKNGYLPKAEHLANNEALCRNAQIMYAAVEEDANMAKYAKGPAINDIMVYAIINGYVPKKEDLENNPQLVNDQTLINKLISIDFNFKVYDPYISKQMKKEFIKEKLLSGNLESLFELPFLREEFDYRLSTSKLREVINSLWLGKVDEGDITVQQRFCIALNKLIDQLINIKYLENKANFEFQSIDQIDLEIKRAFYLLHEHYDVVNFNNLVTRISEFVNGKENEDYLKKTSLEENLIDLFDVYKSNGFLLKEDTTPIYNDILNRHSNNFRNQQRKILIKELIDKLPVSERKKIAVINGVKIKQVSAALREQNIKKTGETKESIENMLKNLESRINKNYLFKKNKFYITDNRFKLLKTLFMNDLLNKSNIKRVLGTENREIINKVIGKYNQIKLLVSRNMDIPPEQIPNLIDKKTNLYINHNDYLIFTIEHYSDVLADIILGMTEERLNCMYGGRDKLKMMAPIIPLTGLMSGFNMKDLFSVFQYISKIDLVKDHSQLKGFSKAMIQCKHYSAMNNIENIVLDEHVLSKVGESQAKKYAEFYTRMFPRYSSLIPPVKGNVSDMTFESGNHIDSERLLIGKNIPASCIDLLNNSGEKTFEFCLTDECADVILFKHEETGEFMARSLVFRKGNTIMLAPIYDVFSDRALRKKLYSKEFFTQFTHQIFNKANMCNDNIDFIFITGGATEKDYHYDQMKDYNVYKNPQLFDFSFPHSDMSEYATLIGVNNKIRDFSIPESLNYSEDIPRDYYLSPREEIKKFEEIENDDITKLRVMNIMLQDDISLKEKLYLGFEPFNKNAYENVILGQDWYIGIKKDGLMEELFLPVGNERASNEFEYAKEEMKQQLDSPYVFRKTYERKI